MILILGFFAANFIVIILLLMAIRDNLKVIKETLLENKNDHNFRM